MNEKNLRIKNIVEKRGVRNVSRIARKIGYGDPPTQEGVQRVLDALKNLKMEVVEGKDGPEVKEREIEDGVKNLDVLDNKGELGMVDRIRNFFKRRKKTCEE